MREDEVQQMAEEDPGKFVDILSEVTKPPCQILLKLIHYRYQFAIGKTLMESETDADPPKRIGPKVDVIPIDEYLGMYDYRKRKITIFKKGIEEASRTIECKPTHLNYVVRLHEWVHALVHIGLSESDRLQVLKDDGYWPECLKRATQIYLAFEDRLHEHLAQLLVYHSLNLLWKDAQHQESKEVIKRIIDTFQVLNKHQPPEYVVDDYLQVPCERVVESLKLLKIGWLKGIFEAWDTVIRW